MKRFVATARGRVQWVGFQEHVYKETFNKKISGYIKDLDSGVVEIVAEGSETDLNAFIERIDIVRYPFAVESLDIQWQKATEEFKDFKIIRGDLLEELFERVDLAGTIMHQTLENSELSLKKQDQALQVEIETKEEIKGLRRDTEKYLSDEFAEIKLELAAVELELAAIKSALERAGIQV